MSFEMTINRIAKVKGGYILAGERGEEPVKIKIKRLYGAKEGDIVEVDGTSLKVLAEKTKKRREEIIKLQQELSE